MRYILVALLLAAGCSRDPGAITVKARDSVQVTPRFVQQPHTVAAVGHVPGHTEARFGEYDWQQIDTLRVLKAPRVDTWEVDTVYVHGPRTVVVQCGGAWTCVEGAEGIRWKQEDLKTRPFKERTDK